ncbi:hypothetical protein [Roseateles asaccharophilus]|uniref:hypothetical protein n=1 Tax=Roseateles asaccharophilus TaxID=582607 RepID=UPI00384ED497
MSWGQRFKSAKDELLSFVEQNVSPSVTGFLSKDSMNMTVFGLVFEKDPGQGFLSVPNEIAADLRVQGLRGDGYFPDPAHPVGKQVMALMNKVSRQAESRPLLTGVPGVQPMFIEDGRLVMSRAQRVDGQIVIQAAPGAVSPTAQVSVIPVNQAEAFEAPAQRQVPTNRPRPS